METKTFNLFADFIYDHCGIRLMNGKEALLSSRLSRRIRELNLGDEMEYFDFVSADQSFDEITRLIDLVTTNVTEFLRGPEHFELISSIIRDTWQRGQDQIKIWSAACSSGQEPYSIAMVAHTVAQSMHRDPNDVKILATDVSTRILDQARRASYSTKEMNSIPDGWKRNYFEQDQDTGRFVVKEHVRELVTFRRLNLASVPFPMKGPFDAILCRNVMIYFDTPVRQNIISEVERLLIPGGTFFLGRSENLSGIRTALTTKEPTIYKLGSK